MAKFSVAECPTGGSSSAETEIELYLKSESGTLYLKARDKNTRRDLPAPYLMTFNVNGGRLQATRHASLDESFFVTEPGRKLTVI